MSAQRPSAMRMKRGFGRVFFRPVTKPALWEPDKPVAFTTALFAHNAGKQPRPNP